MTSLVEEPPQKKIRNINKTRQAEGDSAIAESLLKNGLLSSRPQIS